MANGREDHKPKKCNNIPGSKACLKAQKHNGMLCKNCSFAKFR